MFSTKPSLLPNLFIRESDALVFWCFALEKNSPFSQILISVQKITGINMYLGSGLNSTLRNSQHQILNQARSLITLIAAEFRSRFSACALHITTMSSSPWTHKTCNLSPFSSLHRHSIHQQYGCNFMTQQKGPLIPLYH